MTRRAKYCLKSKAMHDKWFKFFQDRGLNPVTTDTPAEGAVHPRWFIEFDGEPLLEKDYHQPLNSSGHWKRPEYQASYGYDFSPILPDFDRCCVQVFSNDRAGTPNQCRNKAHFDEDYTGKPTRCKRHSRGYIREKQEVERAKREAEASARAARARRAAAKDEALALVLQIAKGHNDPRGAAIDLLLKFDMLEQDNEG